MQMTGNPTPPPPFPTKKALLIGIGYGSPDVVEDPSADFPPLRVARRDTLDMKAFLVGPSPFHSTSRKILY